MATVSQQLSPEEAVFLASLFPQYVRNNGTSFPVAGLAFDPIAIEAGFWVFRAYNYGSGSLTLDIEWYADTATTGTVIFDAQIAAITPDADTQDVETKALAAISSFTDTHLGTVGQRLHRAVITLVNLDAIATNDIVWLRLARNGGTMTGDAIVTLITLSYSDT